jgi:hypothetical protein
MPFLLDCRIFAWSFREYCSEKWTIFVNITNLVAITTPQPFGFARPCLDDFISQSIDCSIAECRSFRNVMRFSKVEEVEYIGYFEEKHSRH